MSHYDEVLRRWTVPVESREISTSFGTTHLLVWGNPAGQPLVLLTGADVPAAYMGLVPDYLSQHFRLYAPDLIGQPGKSAPVRPPTNDDSYSRWLVEILN